MSGGGGQPQSARDPSKALSALDTLTFTAVHCNACAYIYLIKVFCTAQAGGVQSVLLHLHCCKADVVPSKEC